MKRMFVLAFLPLVLFGLETVNLIKDAGFEKDSELWDCYVGRDDGNEAAAIANKHDSEKYYSGNYSASCDTREGDETVLHYDSAIIIQGFCCEKNVSDLDSLTLRFSLAPFIGGLTQGCWVSLLIDIGEPQFWDAGYILIAKGQTPLPPPPPRKMIGYDNFLDDNDTSWVQFSEDIKTDLLNNGISDIANVDSFLLEGFGGYIPPWHGQKVYWDDIRLMGYADYDVGVKEILSPEVISQGESYTPVARIKNFGREPADSFLVIVEASDGRTDTLPWALPPDTEDTVTFATWEWPEIPQYFTVRTVMDPDESDADDELLQGITVAGIQYPTLQDDRIDLQVISSRAGILKVSFGIPDQQVGSLTVYDATGRRIERMEVKGSGRVELGTGLASGVYIVRLECGSSSSARKAVVLR